MSKKHGTFSELHRNVPWGESKEFLIATQWGNEQPLYVYPPSRVLALTALGTGQKGRDSDSRLIRTNEGLQHKPVITHFRAYHRGCHFFFFFFSIFWPSHMACKILGSHPRIELMPPISNVLTTGLPGKPLFSLTGQRVNILGYIVTVTYSILFSYKSLIK